MIFMLGGFHKEAARFSLVQVKISEIESLLFVCLKDSQKS